MNWSSFDADSLISRNLSWIITKFVHSLLVYLCRNSEIFCVVRENKKVKNSQQKISWKITLKTSCKKKKKENQFDQRTELLLEADSMHSIWESLHGWVCHERKNEDVDNLCENFHTEGDFVNKKILMRWISLLLIKKHCCFIFWEMFKVQTIFSASSTIISTWNFWHSCIIREWRKSRRLCNKHSRKLMS